MKDKEIIEADTQYTEAEVGWPVTGIMIVIITLILSFIACGAHE